MSVMFNGNITAFSCTLLDRSRRTFLGARSWSLASVVLIASQVFFLGGCGNHSSTVPEKHWPATSISFDAKSKGVKMVAGPGKCVYVSTMDWIYKVALDSMKVERSVNLRGSGKDAAFLRSIALLPDAKTLLVTGYPDALFIIDAANLDTTDLLKIPSGASAIVVDDKGSTAYIAGPTGNMVSLVDLHTKSVVKQVPVGKEPASLALDSERQKLYVGYDSEPYISCIDLTSLSEIRRYPVSSPKGAVSLGVPLIIGIRSLVISDDGSFIFAGGRADNNLYRIKLSNGQVDKVKLPNGCYGLATVGSMVFPATEYLRGDTLYVPMFDTHTFKLQGLLKSADLKGAFPADFAITASPDGKQLINAVVTSMSYQMIIFSYSVTDPVQSRD